jgi:hypothetical protein
MLQVERSARGYPDECLNLVRIAIMALLSSLRQRL